MAGNIQQPDLSTCSVGALIARFRLSLRGQIPIGLVFLVGLFLRIFLVARASPNELLGPDSPTYLGPARALLASWRFLIEAGSTDFMFVRTPGYPTLLAGAITLVGDDVKRLALFQALVLSLLVIACYLMAMKVVSRKVSLVVAGAVALDPLLIYSSGQILTEGPHTVLLLLVGGGLSLVARSSSVGMKSFFVIGLTVSAATMIRPTTYYLPLILVPFGAVLLRRRKTGPVLTAKCLLAGIIPLLIFVGGWQVRNEIRVDSMRFSGIEAINMYFFRAGGIIAEQRGRPFEEVLNELLSEYPPRGRDESQGQYYDSMYQKGTEIVRSNLPDYMVVVAKAVPRMTLGESGMFLDYADIPRSFLTVWSLRIFNLVVWSLWALTVCAAVALSRWRAVVLALAIPTVYVILISAGAEAYSRFRTPVMPLVYLVCGIGMAIGAEFLSGRQQAVQKPVASKSGELGRN